MSQEIIKLGGLPGDASEWKELFENANELIQSVDKDGRFLYVNKKWQDTLGYAANEASRLAFPNIIHPNHLQECFAAFAEMQKGKSFDNFRTRFITKDGCTLDVEGNISVRMKDVEFISTWGIFRDVTARNQREQELDHIAKMLVRRDFELLQTNDVLRIRDEQIVKEQELNRAKSEFVSLASHQLKTPLTIIKWYINMLNAGYANNILEKQKEYIGIIYANTERMVELLDVFLNVSRLELGVFPIKKETVNLKDRMELILQNFDPKIKEKTLKILKIYFPKQRQLATGQAKNPLLPPPRRASDFVISTDVKMMQIIFENLISNAIKYTPSGGEIKITMRKKENKILIIVADAGVGIPENQQSKIFTKFFRADNVASRKIDGSGLGLYIVKTIVEKMGGKIWFESSEHKGTAFFTEFSC
ncbi:MAG: hypothetical protein A3I29_02340 [Candidatus Magasanikbacteria bacterium RIFCSPLOWO2_02_FULL_44_11]|uniref:histidine kinase n=1 Tax=Candidatus Magasanikbacteria bacterium RIFCSPLOWO2_02_FULL_44_11 TaxID=1798689 RepID=A0A1F6N9G3_9BACT|nr:MAG: hypothetical protein A3I29_02340 [Candidatus Magasanikbacteria bacterium RIFCSPLOWO2_02_FULL_44_11]